MKIQLRPRRRCIQYSLQKPAQNTDELGIGSSFSLCSPTLSERRSSRDFENKTTYPVPSQRCQHINRRIWRTHREGTPETQFRKIYENKVIRGGVLSKKGGGGTTISSKKHPSMSAAQQNCKTICPNKHDIP